MFQMNYLIGIVLFATTLVVKSECERINACNPGMVICPHSDYPHECCRLEDQYCDDERGVCDSVFDDDVKTNDERRKVCCKALLLDNYSDVDKKHVWLRQTCTYRLGMFTWNETCSDSGPMAATDEPEAQTETTTILPQAGQCKDDNKITHVLLSAVLIVVVISAVLIVVVIILQRRLCKNVEHEPSGGGKSPDDVNKNGRNSGKGIDGGDDNDGTESLMLGEITSLKSDGE